MNIEVGKTKTLFQIHEGLLRQHSVWFSTRLNGSWGDVRNVELPDDLPHVFELFEEFMYRNQLLAPSAAASARTEVEKPPAKKKQKVQSKHHSELTLAQLYVFADLRQCARLSCAAMDAFRTLKLEIWSFTTAEVIQYIYENTPKTSGYRKFVIDDFVNLKPTETFLSVGGYERRINPDMHPDFLSEVALAACKARCASRKFWRKKDMLRVSPCEYHDHEKPNENSEEDTDDTSDSD